MHEATLRCIGHEEFAPLSRLNEVAEKIQEILGLDYEQFRKIVMIPQGEFRRFCNSSFFLLHKIAAQTFFAAFTGSPSVQRIAHPIKNCSFSGAGRSGNDKNRMI